MRAASSFHLRSRRTISSRLLERLLAAAVGVERNGEIEPRLDVGRIGLDLIFQRRRIAGLACLLGELERRERGGD